MHASVHVCMRARDHEITIVKVGLCSLQVWVIEGGENLIHQRKKRRKETPLGLDAPVAPPAWFYKVNASQHKLGRGGSL